jgi:DNA helicase HerA-like ATPase
MGRRIAQAVVRDNISCVISTFGLPKVAMRQIIADFAEELLNLNNTPRHVFIEEAHEFVPQRVMGAMAKTFSAVEALVVMGRNRGIGVTLINQRAATINKDVLTQLDTGSTQIYEP